MNGVKLDGTLYHVRKIFNSLEDSFSLVEGPNSGDMLSGRHERDLLGTSYSFQFSVEPDPAYPEDYDAFYWAISAPVDSHLVEMPFGQGTMEFQAMVQSGRRIMGPKIAGLRRYSGLEVSFIPIEPQRPAE